MIRAAWNTATGKGKQSGSTITQQYVKNYYLAQEQTVTRKVKEFFISIKLDREKSKDDILEGYLNTSYFGRNAYGIQAAAQAYYGIDVEDLDDRPGRLPRRAAQRAQRVRRRRPPREQARGASPAGTTSSTAWSRRAGSPRPSAPGMKFPEPKQAEAAAGHVRPARLPRRGRQRLPHRQQDPRRGRPSPPAATASPPPSQKPKQDAFVKAVDDQVMDKLDKKNRKVDNYVRAGGVSIDPTTGKVLAMYGGIDYTKQYVNNATRRDYQVGSTFKPFVFTSAVQNDSTTQDGRTITPNTVYDGTNKRPVQGWERRLRTPPRTRTSVSYGDITVRTATDKSVNAVYAQMAVDVGSGQGQADRHRPRHPVRHPRPDRVPVDRARPGHGQRPRHGGGVRDPRQPRQARHVHDRRQDHQGRRGRGRPARAQDPAGRQPRGRRHHHVRPAERRRGRHRHRRPGRRTGPPPARPAPPRRTQAAWFAGYTPDLATVVAVMGQDPDTGAHKSLYGALGQPRINGGGYPAQIWAQYTKAALKGSPAQDFDLRLQDGAEEQQLPPADPDEDQPGTDAGQDNGGTTTGGEETPATEGQTGGTTTDGGTTGDGGTTTDGGTTGDGGTTTGGATTGGGTGYPTGGTTTDGGTTDGGTTDGSTTDGQATTTGSRGRLGGFP